MKKEACKKHVKNHVNEKRSLQETCKNHVNENGKPVRNI